MLDRLREMTDGNEERIKLYIDTYRAGMQDAMSSLRTSLSEHDLKSIRTIVHTTKPLFTLMAEDELWAFANDIEVSIDNERNLGDIEERSEQLISSMRASLERLEKEI